MTDRERWRRGDRERREPELDWRRRADERGVPLDDARTLYEEALRCAEYPGSRSADALYLEWLDHYTAPTPLPAPGRRTLTMRAQAQAAGLRRGREVPGPGKRTLASYLEPARRGGPDAGAARPALAADVAPRLERAFDLRLDDVVVHPDSAEVAAGQQAFTRGGEIYLEAGLLDGDAAHGERVLAHELAHVVQQRGPSRGIEVVDHDHLHLHDQRRATSVDELEHDADQAALNVLAGRAAAVRFAAPMGAALGFSKGKGKGVPVEPLARGAAPRASQPGRDDKAHATGAGAGRGADGLIMRPAPESLTPGAAQRLDHVGDRNQTAGALTTTLPSGEQSTDKARASVEEPTVEQDAHAQHDVVTEVDSRPPPSPEIEAACARIRQVIKAKRPPDEDKLVEADPSAMAAEAGHEMDAGVESRTDSVHQEYQDVQESPKGQPSRQPVPVDLPPSKVATPAVDAGTAAPDELHHDDVSLDQDAAAQDKKLDDAGMNTEPAKLVQDGPIGDARGGVDDLKKMAKTDPQKVLADQTKAITKAKGDMRALQASADKALADARVGTVQNVGTQSHQIKGSEEQQRARAGQQMQDIFQRTQRAVESLLQPLSRTAMARWTAGVARLSSEFEASLAGVKQRIDDRHKGDGSLLGDLGAGLTELGDDVFGLPDWVTEAYDRAEAAFADGCTDLLRDISRDVNDVIDKCKKLIQQARQDIDKVVQALPKDLQTWARGEATRLGGELDKLDKKVDDTQRNINKDLISRANGAVQDVRQRVHELREAAKGLIGKIADAIGAFLANPFKAIVDGLLRLLGISPGAFWALVGQLGDVVSAIAREPVRFANTLIDGSGQGFKRFFDNFPHHLGQGLFSWLFGALGADGVQVPSDFSGPSIMGMVLGLVGIDAGLVDSLLSHGLEADELAEAKAEASAALSGGPLGLVHLLAEHFDPGSIVPMIKEAAISFLVTAIIKQAAIRIIALFNPAGAILQAIELIFKTLIWVVQNAARIFTLIQTLVGAAGMMAAGNVAGVAAAVEGALAQIIPLVLDFLAGMVGVGGLPRKIREILTKLGGKLKSALHKVIDAISRRAKTKAKAKRDQKKAAPDKHGDDKKAAPDKHGDDKKAAPDKHGDDKKAAPDKHGDDKKAHDDDEAARRKRDDDKKRDEDKKRDDDQARKQRDDEREADQRKHADDDGDRGPGKRKRDDRDDDDQQRKRDDAERDRKRKQEDEERDRKKREHDDQARDRKKRKHDDDDPAHVKRKHDDHDERDPSHDEDRRRAEERKQEDDEADKRRRLARGLRIARGRIHGLVRRGVAPSALRSDLSGIATSAGLTRLWITSGATWTVRGQVNPEGEADHGITAEGTKLFSAKEKAQARALDHSAIRERAAAIQDEFTSTRRRDNPPPIPLENVEDRLAFGSLFESGSAGRRAEVAIGSGGSAIPTTFSQFNRNSIFVHHAGSSQTIFRRLREGAQRVGMTEEQLMQEIDHFAHTGELDPRIRRDPRLANTIARELFRQDAVEPRRIPTHLADRAGALERTGQDGATIGQLETPADLARTRGQHAGAVAGHREASARAQRHAQGEPEPPNENMDVRAGRLVLAAASREAALLDGKLFENEESLVEMLVQGIRRHVLRSES